MGSYSLSSVRRFKYMPHLAMEVDGPALEALASDPEVITLTEMRRKGIEGVPAGSGGLAGALFAGVESGDMNGIVIGAKILPGFQGQSQPLTLQDQKRRAVYLLDETTA